VTPLCQCCGRALVDGAHHPAVPPPYCCWDIRSCPDGVEHVWGETRDYVAVGPMEGSWLVADCERCGVGSLRSVEDPANSLAAFLGALEAHGCDPRPAP
jgi:hypothetical protein